jgi:uncharacterized protein (DUF433 family)
MSPRRTCRGHQENLGQPRSYAEILADFPTLAEEDIRAAIAAASAQEDLPLLETPIRR